MSTRRPKNAPIDLDSVARFARVAEARSFAGASVRTGLPKSTLSRAVSRLEHDLGVRLLERTTRNVRLTDEGGRLYEAARRGLDLLDEALDEVSDTPARVRGALRISAPPDLGDVVLAGLVEGFLRAQPEIRLEVELSSRFVDLVGEGFDAALRAGRLRDSALVARKLIETPFGFYAAPSLVAEHGAPKKLDDLTRLPALLFRAKAGEQPITVTGPRGSTRIVLEGSLSTDDLNFLRGCCVRGIGFALLPCFAVQQDLAANRLVRILPTYGTSGGALHLVYPSARNAPARLVAFRDYAVGYFGELWARRDAPSAKRA